jgi:alpha-glucosidase (family GH31 glycosyl hydrolase)
MRRAALLALVAALPLASPATAGAADRTVDAGALRATATTDPWHLEFSGGAALSEARGTDTSLPGTLGYASGGTWFHATRVVAEQQSAASYQATLATTDPAGGRIHVSITRDADGVIALTATPQPSLAQTVSQTGISFDPRAGERFLGFGERSNAVDQRGQTIENYVAEGPYQPEERPAIAAFVPAPGFHPRDDATYFPIPWLLSTAGYGVLVDNDERSEFHLASDDAATWSATVDAAELRLRVFAGPTAAAALRRFTASTGRQPPPAAPWFLGPWFQPSGDAAANIDALRQADAPASVMQTYTHYLPCGDHQGRTDEERARTAASHAAGLAITTYFNPMICTDYKPVYDEAVNRGYLTKDALGRPYEYRYTGSSQFLVGQFDFSNPDARAFYGDLLAEAVGNGYDGWMEDFGEYTPTDARSSDRTPGTQMHNRYVQLYHRAAHEFSAASRRPLARFNRSGWTGTARYSQVVWGGDPTTDWGFDGLESAVRNGLTMGLSGVSVWGSDIGGFFTLSAPQLGPELLARWIEFGAVSGVMRTQANGFTIGDRGRRAQITDPEVLPVWRRYSKLRTQLYPYIAAAAREYGRSGLPIMRHLALVHPGDPQATARDDEFMFGPDLLAAPVTQPGSEERSLYLPRGAWVDVWRSTRIAADGSLQLTAPRLLAGGAETTLPAPLAELPLLARVGTVLPLLPADVDTLTGYGNADGLVHLRDRARTMRLLAFPRGRRTREIGRRETVTSIGGSTRWRLRIRGRRTRAYRLQASLGTLRRPFRPCSVTLRARRLRPRQWSYNSRAQLLRVRFRIRSGLLTASTCRTRRH